MLTTEASVGVVWESKSEIPTHLTVPHTEYSDENKVIRIAKCDVFSGVCESIR